MLTQKSAVIKIILTLLSPAKTASIISFALRYVTFAFFHVISSAPFMQKSPW